MTTHARQQVRAAVVTDLTGLTTTGSSVFTARVSALVSTELPAWLVSLRDEQAGFDVPGTLSRSGQVVLEGVAEGGDGLEDKLDLMAAEAEAAIYDADGATMALLMNIGAPVTVIDLGDPENGQARRIGRIRLQIPVVYRTVTTDPTTIA